jgi:MFS family permease
VPDMKSIIKNILPPLSAILLTMLGTGFFLSFTSLRLDTLGFDGWVVGVVHSAYYLGMLIGAARAEKIINRVGHIRAYAAYTGVGVICLMAQGLTPNPLIWVFIRVVMGFCLAVYYIVVESWFLSSSTQATRGAILSLYMITLYLAQASSQFILNIINLDSSEPFFVAALFASASIITLSLSKAPSPQLHDQSGYSFKSLLKQSQFGFMGCFISGIILSSIYSFAPLFAATNELSVSLTVGVCILGGVLFQWPVGKLSDIFDRRRVLFGLTVFTALQAILLVFIPPHGVLIYALLFTLGGLVFTLYPLSITQVCDNVQPHGLTKATGTLLLTYGIGAVIGPVIAPVFIDAFPVYGLFLFIAVNAIALIIMGIFSFKFSPPVPEKMQIEFVSLPLATPVAYNLDPRIEEGLEDLDDEEEEESEEE